MSRSRITRLNLNDADAQQILIRIASDSAQVFFTDHAREQMRRRKISVQQVIGCLLRGSVTESPVLDHYGNWKLTMQAKVAGEHLGCAVAICTDLPKAIVITAFWVN